MADTTNYQDSSKYIPDMRDFSKTDFDAFREYYVTNVEIDNKTPTAKDKDLIKVVTLSISNDSELHSRFTEWLSQTINMYPFQLTQENLNASNLPQNWI